MRSHTRGTRDTFGAGVQVYCRTDEMNRRASPKMRNGEALAVNINRPSGVQPSITKFLK